MIRSLYTGISGLRNHQTRMDVVSNNIANVNTTGFKYGRANFQDTLSQTIGRTGVNPATVGLGVNLAGIDNMFTQGGLQTTYRTLDLAIEGNGFFVVADPNDTTKHFFTRDGTLYVDGGGILVDAHGNQVLNKDGSAITLSTTPSSIKSIEIDENGGIFVDGATKGIVGLVMVNNPESLTKIGNNYYVYTSGLTKPDTESIAAPNTNGRGKIRSGYLEMSNVDLAQEFTNMITTQRGYQANARSITTSDELLQELVNLKR